jgi:hypothetical protein
MFVHLGIGWDGWWLSVIAIQSYMLVKAGSAGRTYYPSTKVVRAVAIGGWVIPIIWFTVIGLSADAYASSGYYCWLKQDPVCILEEVQRLCMNLSVR